MLDADLATTASVMARHAALWDAQEFDKAERLARAGVGRFPADRNVRTALAHALLMQGRYREGFRENELREHRLKAPPHQLTQPEWDGPLAGRSILVWGEQGIGDELMMFRYIRTLRELGAARITVTCWPQSIRAFQQIGADLVVGRFGSVEVPKHDCWISALSIPYRLGLDLRDISGAPYLSAEPRQGGGIGLVERGRPENPRDAERSLPHGLLQEAVPQGRLLQPEGDVYDALCRLAGLDLLITVDTAWAHMAGALGVPCWVLLPFRQLDWRWGRKGATTPWYDSLRLIRQQQPSDWTGPIEEVRERLRGLS